MNLSGKIARNTIIHLGGKVAGLIFGLVALAMMTRYLGQTGFGYYTIIIAFLQFFGILVDFGLTLTTVQLISEPNRDISKTMNSLISLRWISAAIFLALAPIVIWFFPYPEQVKFGAIIGVLSFFFIAIFQTLTPLFQLKLKMTQVTIAEVFGKVVMVLGVWASVYWDLGLYWILTAISLGSFLNMFVAWYFSRSEVAWSWKIDTSVWKEAWHRTWPIALSITFNLLYLKTDAIILSYFRSPEDVGLYGASYRIIDILTMLPAVFMSIVLPVATRMFVEKKIVDLKELLQKAFSALMIIGVPIVLGGILLARKLMVFVAGAEFAESGEILKILLLASFAIFVTTLSGYAIVALNKQKIMLWGYLTAAILTMIGYFYAIPIYGYWGAAWMTVFSEVFIMVWTLVVVWQTIKFFPKLKILGQSFMASSFMCLALLQVPSWPLWALLLIAVVVYFPVLYVLGGLKKETLKEIITIK